MNCEQVSHERFRHFFEKSQDLLVLLDGQGHIIDANQRWCTKLGYRQEFFLGKNWLDSVSADDYDYVCQKGDLLKTGHEINDVVHRLVAQDGSFLWVNLSAFPDAENRWVYMIFKDISLQKKLEAELHKMEIIDEMSGVYNRRYFLNRSFEELLRSVRYESEISLLVLDIDHLHVINEKHGQYAGDLVVRKVADICKKTLRNTDLLGRLGSGEFSGLLIETSKSGAKTIALRISQNLSEMCVMVGEVEVSFTVSIGVSCKQAKDASMEDILRRAQDALKQAKAGGGNQVDCGDDQ